MTKVFGYFIVTLIGLAGLYVILFGVSKAIERQDRATCERFAVDMQERPNFYLTTSEQEMCDYLNVPVVRTTNSQAKVY